MKKLFVLVASCAVPLGLTGVANAGCMATVGLSSPPKTGLAAGTPWFVTVRVLQHGRTPMPDAKPEVRIRTAAGRLLVFKGTPTARIGSYRVRVVFPEAGRYAFRVYDGFPYKECARVHSFAPVDVGADT